MAEFKDTEITPDKDIKPIKADNEKEYLRGIGKKNKEFLVKNLSVLEKERIAKYVCERIKDVESDHKELCSKIDEWDETYRMERKEIIGADADMPNYQSPLSTVSLEVMHSNIMNVFFTPRDLARALPIEEGDMPKVDKLSTFMNWSSINELGMQEQIDRLFHSSEKVGEAPYMVHWVKEYGTEIKRTLLVNPANPGEPLYDPDTKEPLFQEIEEAVLTYNGPRLEVFSRKDYKQAKSSMMGKTPPWESRIIRHTYDTYLRDQLQNKMYNGSIKEITGWGEEDNDTTKIDFEGRNIPTDKWEQEFEEWYGRMRILVIKEDNESDTTDFEELEDEFIAVVHVKSQTLCSLRRNRFPLKMRPLGVDYFIADDEGRRTGIGVMEFMDSLQTAYDSLYNQFIQGTVKSNNPVVFFEPTGNMRDEKIKLDYGFMYGLPATASMKIFSTPPPNNALQLMLEIINTWAQLLFGISDYSSGIESRIDPSAPAKKAEIVVAQGNVRMNAIIKRKNSTLRDILKRWYLLYKENMPPNKFMRIAGAGEDPFKFQKVTANDFALKSIPDFELTGNILNSNKSLEMNKAIAVYQMLLTNPFFNPQTKQGQQSLHAMTKWFIDKLDEVGLSSFLPDPQGDMINTPEEENSRFLQGDAGEPANGEDHVNHIKVHMSGFVNDPNIPDDLKEGVIEHIKAHVKMLQEEVTQQAIISQLPSNQRPGGQDVGQGQSQQGAGGAQGGTPGGVLQGQPVGVAGR